ncbi:hypothetical protein L226DRAFT_394565 [Lentinus tigrinus ALCF2SS1-7]|uniref:F-box domain-containing protein n=1 Tax=Lentinus tigrinus ALCF2SS1-6 TaxID=1328759 RepID=A0A5C2SJX6_9APHY|nr:hypothetical protein L227DRAFT_562728 [Lentinus tigrinus ALCF2SS1-6]RPD76005.1 hypothetical protein L226DRAFT_394565 [Lentinus tigrinus ALCF2SS1-7]
MPISLSSFSFTTPLWRKDLMWRALRSDPQAELEAALSSEASSLSALVPRLHETAEQLTLPMEATPVLSMSERSWSKLHSLSFHGSYVDVAQMEAFPLFFSKVPRLRNLFMTVHQLRNTVHRRAPILGHRLPGDLFQPASIRLRSLTVAYPDPDDDIFSVDVTDLHQLSLRDWPRYYGNLAYEDSQSTGSPAPILTHAECLSILRRMNMPRLTSLELVYLVDPGFADDELLSYISRAFPRLEHLQLHRYRADREEYVDYEHIAKLLVAARSLRTVRLNLDLHGDHGPYCNFVPTLQSWLAKFRDEIGPSIIGILQDLPLLECCELLYHQVGGSTWTEFRPANGPEPHFIEYHDQDIHMDSELLPLQMRRRYRYGRFTRRSFWDGVE